MKVKIKDLPEDFQLVGKILCIPLQIRRTNFELLPKMTIKSGWNKGFWCIKKRGDSRIFPVFFENFDEVKEWEVELDSLDMIFLKGG